MKEALDREALDEAKEVLEYYADPENLQRFVQTGDDTNGARLDDHVSALARHSLAKIGARLTGPAGPEQGKPQRCIDLLRNLADRLEAGEFGLLHFSMGADIARCPSKTETMNWCYTGGYSLTIRYHDINFILEPMKP